MPWKALAKTKTQAGFGKPWEHAAALARGRALEAGGFGNGQSTKQIAKSLCEQQGGQQRAASTGSWHTRHSAMRPRTSKCVPTAPLFLTLGLGLVYILIATQVRRHFAESSFLYGTSGKREIPPICSPPQTHQGGLLGIIGMAMCVLATHPKTVK